MKRKQNSTKSANRRGTRDRESGYAFLMALFLVLALVISSQVVLRKMATEGRSEREGDMIWRGDQYTRAIRMYYRKTGHYPQTQDDLLTGVPNIHFLRSEVIKDPMNKNEDGAWRFIYTNAAGQIIGSVKYGSLQQMALMDMNGGQMPGTPQSGTDSTAQSSPSSGTDAGTSNTSGSANGTAQTGNAGPGIGNGFAGAGPVAGGLGAAPAAGGLGAGQVLGPLGQPGAALGASQPTGPVDGPVIGGQLAGVGSKVDETSVRVYKGGKKYNEWEFIWNPLEEQARAVQQNIGQAGAGGQSLQGLLPGGLPLGSSGAMGGTPTSSPNNGSNSGSNTPNTNPQN